jgi:Neuraminidase (sialidase)
MLITDKKWLERAQAKYRAWQGIASVERTKGGRMFVSFFTGVTAEQMGNYTAIIKSDDNGKTWTEPKQILPNYGGAPSHILETPDGTLVATYGYRSTKPYKMKAMFSFDKGETWDAGYTLYDNYDSPDLAYPSSLMLENGNILTIFYARAQETPPSVVWQIEWNFEKD